MRGACKLFVAAAVVLGAWPAFPLAASAQAPDQKPMPDQPPPPRVMPSPDPGISGPIVSDEDLWTAHLSDEPQRKAEAAMASLRSGDLKNARENVLKLASHVYIAAARSDGEARKITIASLEELKKTADRISAGSLVSADALAPILARALQSLSYHHAIKASEKWLGKKEIPAGYELQAAEMDYRDALTWVGREPDAPVAVILNDAQELSVRLIREEKITDREVTSAITGLTRKAQDLGDFLRGFE